MSELLVKITANLDLKFTEMPEDIKNKLLEMIKKAQDKKSKTFNIEVEEK